MEAIQWRRCETTPMTPSSDPTVEPSYTRASVEAYLRAVVDHRQQLESEIDEARARTERARVQLERIRGWESGPDTLVTAPVPVPAPAPAPTPHPPPAPAPAPAPAEIVIAPDAGGSDTGTAIASSSLIDQLRLTVPAERDGWERSEVPSVVDHE